jgi:hypothetical protein
MAKPFMTRAGRVIGHARVDQNNTLYDGANRITTGRSGLCEKL